MSSTSSTGSATEVPAWPGYPDAPRPSFAAPFVPRKQTSTPVVFTADHPRRAIPGEVEPASCGCVCRDCQADNHGGCREGKCATAPAPTDPFSTRLHPIFTARWSPEEYATRGRATIAASDRAGVLPDSAGYWPRRGLTPTLRAEVRRRSAAGEVPVTHLEVARAAVDHAGALDVELAEATPDEQAEASVRLAEETEGRRLSATELRVRFAPSYAFIKAVAKLIATRAEAEQMEAKRAGSGVCGSSLVDQMLEEMGGRE